MKDILIDNKDIYNFEYYFLKIFGFLTKFIVFLFIFGFIQDKPFLYLEVNFFVKVCLALFLIYRFNKYRKNKIEFTDLDRKVCYSAGIYILIISFTDYIQNYVSKIQNFIQPYTKPIINDIYTKLKFLSF